jgi:hypothetical protein
VVVQRGGGLEKTPDCFTTADGGETVCGVRAQARQGGPSTLQDRLRAASHAAVAAAQSSRGEAVDVLAGQEGGLQCLCREAVGGGVGALRQQADCPDRRFLRPCAVAAELQRGNHVWTQWGHERSPFLSGRVAHVSRKTS